jgi:hypothetical protein
MIEWLVLLAAVVFFMYLWTTKPWEAKETKGGCGVCGKQKNVQFYE